MTEKNEEVEQQIPQKWWPIIKEIVERIRTRCLTNEDIMGARCCVDSDDVILIYNSIDAYGEAIISLPDETWKSSVCRWMGNYWHLLVDLFTADEGLSDLVLFLNVQDSSDAITFTVRSVHVP